VFVCVIGQCGCLCLLACSITASADTEVDIWRRNVKSSDCSVAVKPAWMLLKNLLSGCWRLRRDANSPLTHCYVIAGLRRFRSFHFSLVKWLLFAPTLEIFHVMSRKTVQMQSFCLSSLLVLHWATFITQSLGPVQRTILRRTFLRSFKFDFMIVSNVSRIDLLGQYRAL